MRLVRFLARSFFDGRIVEPGEELVVADDVFLGAHMLDLTSGTTPTFAERVVNLFRADLAHVPGEPPLSPDELRERATEEAMARAEATRQAEAAAHAAEETDTSGG